MDRLYEAANEAAQFALNQPDTLVLRGFLGHCEPTGELEWEYVFKVIDKTVERLWHFTTIADLIPKRD